LDIQSDILTQTHFSSTFSTILHIVLIAAELREIDSHAFTDVVLA